MWLKIRDSYLICKVANKFLNVRERLEVVKWNKRWSPPFPCSLVNLQCLWKKTLTEKVNNKKSHLPQSSWPKVNFRDDSRNIFGLFFSFFQTLFKKWKNNKLTVIRDFFTWCFLLHSIVHYYKRIDIMVTVTLRKNQIRTIFHVFWRIKSFSNIQFCVVDKQLFSPLSWNNLLSKTSLDESSILISERHLDVKKKHYLDVEGVFYLLLGRSRANSDQLSRGQQLFKVHYWHEKFAIFPFAKRLMSLKRNSYFMRYFSIGYHSGKWSENFLQWH